MVWCENKCGARLQQRYLANHMSNECHKRTQPCRYCGKQFVFETLQVINGGRGWGGGQVVVTLIGHLYVLSIILIYRYFLLIRVLDKQCDSHGSFDNSITHISIIFKNTNLVCPFYYKVLNLTTENMYI